MLTFSVNPQMDDVKAKKVYELVQQVDEKYKDYISQAFLNIVEDTSQYKKSGSVNLAGFARSCKKEEYRLLATENRMFVPLPQEGEGGGSMDLLALADPQDIEMDYLYREELMQYVSDFLDIREYVFFQKGWDLWRVLMLVRKGDSQAMMRARSLMEELHLMDFFKVFCGDLNMVYVTELLLEG